MAKTLQDNLFKGFVLNSIGDGHNSLASIHTHLLHGDFDYEFEYYDIETSKLVNIHFKENYDKYDGIRRELQYLRSANYIKMSGDKKPFSYTLLQKGKVHSKNPFINKNFKNEEWNKSVRGIVKAILEDDEQIEELSEKKRIDKCKTCKSMKPKPPMQPSTPPSKMTKTQVNARKKSIKVPDADGNIREISVHKNLDDNFIRTLQEMIDFNGKIDENASTIMTLQNENAELRKIVGRAGVELVKANTKLERNDQKNEKTMQRQYSRQEIADAYWADEHGNAYPLTQEFFDLWRGDYMVVVLEKVLELGQIFEAGKCDVLSKGSEMYQRRKRYIRRELFGDEIYQQGIYIQEIKSSGIIIDSGNMIAPKLLKW